jgi:hypothetical protein
MSGAISIHDMQNFAETLPEINISSDIGNVIQLGSNGPSEADMDDLGFNLLSNTNVSVSRPAAQQQSSGILEVPASRASANDINIGPLEPLEGVAFDIPSADGPAPTLHINKESSYGSSSAAQSSSYFDNAQSATGPDIHLASPTRLSAEEERKQKIDLINKLGRLETKGYAISKRFTMDNSLDEIKAEFERLMDSRNLETSIKFQRQMMMGVVTGLEMMNTKFNPFDWQLDGWSESVHENLEDFDEVFEELYDKYKGRGNMPPEARMLFMLVGSGFMFHMSNNFFRSKMGGTTMDDILKNNPMLAKQMAAAAAQAAGPGFGNFMGAAMGVPGGGPAGGAGMASAPPTGAFFQAPSAAPPPMSSSGRGNLSPQPSMAPPPMARREMRGPSGVDDILKTFEEVRNAEMNMGGPTAMPPPPPSVLHAQPAVQALNEIQSVHSGDDHMSQGTSATGRGGRRKKPFIPVTNAINLNV